MALAVPPEFHPTLFSGAAPPSGGVVIFGTVCGMAKEVACLARRRCNTQIFRFTSQLLSG
jgi:hypothetical protein